MPGGELQWATLSGGHVGGWGVTGGQWAHSHTRHSQPLRYTEDTLRDELDARGLPRERTSDVSHLFDPESLESLIWMDLGLPPRRYGADGLMIWVP